MDELIEKLTAAAIGDLIVGIDHIGIAVRDVGRSGALWQALTSQPLQDQEDVAAANATAGFVRWPKKHAAVELVAPFQGNKGLEKFIDGRGETLHHLALAVSDINEALARLDRAGVALVDKTPRTGAGGHQVAFLHPKAMAGTLVELIQHEE